MSGLRVLIVEDEAEAALRLAAHLSGAGHRVRIAATLVEADALREVEAPDVIVLDRVIDGVDSLATLGGSAGATGGRLFAEPVLVLTALASVAQRVAGLDAGADDYLAKPAHPAEVEARLRALVRRPTAGSETITFGSLRIDRLTREAWHGARRLALQPREFRLLEELAIGAGMVVSRRTLLERVWNLTFDPRTKLIETHMSRLRDKLGQGEGMPAILTVRGVGYKLALG